MRYGFSGTWWLYSNCMCIEIVSFFYDNTSYAYLYIGIMMWRHIMVVFIPAELINLIQGTTLRIYKIMHLKHYLSFNQHDHVNIVSK